MLRWLRMAALAAGLLMGTFSVEAQQCNSTMSRSDMRANLKELADDLLQRWPNAGAAIQESNAHGVKGAVWWWSHKKKSVDGFGPTVALVSGQPPGFVGSHADGDGTWFEGFSPKPLLSDKPHFKTPNLLFFERTGKQSSWREWPLIGFGYAALFEPCDKPITEIPCFAADDWFIHEAGYHRVLIGDGGMTLAVTRDLCRDPWPQQGIASTGCSKSDYDVDALDPQGCHDIDTEDIEVHANRIRHGRFWDLHVWVNPDDDKKPKISILDPFERWKNAPSGRIAMPDVNQAFYYQDTDECLCGTPQQIDLVAAMAGRCKVDANCADDEYCDAGIDFKKNRCEKLRADHESCPAFNGGDVCEGKHCNLGRCYTPYSVDLGGTCYLDRACESGKCSAADGFKGQCVCEEDRHCADDQYCDAGVDFKQNQCRALKADNETCDLLHGGRTCASGNCKFSRCYTPNSVDMGGVCYMDAACDDGKCSSIDGTKGTCVCDSDNDCKPNYWCDKGLDFKKNQCKRKYNKGVVCGTVGDLGVGHRCKSGKCKVSGISTKLKCK